MEKLWFKCDMCDKYLEMKREVEGAFVDWAYGCGQWSDFEEEVPALSTEDWVRSSKTPTVGTVRTILVKAPFEESVGNEFLMLYQPDMEEFVDWLTYSDDTIRECAVVRCRFEKVLRSDDMRAWIQVKILEVIFLHDIYKQYDEVLTDESIDEFSNIPEDMCMTIFENDRWDITTWTAQADCGEIKWIYTDDSGTRRLIMQRWYEFHMDILFLGNIREY